MGISVWQLLIVLAIVLLLFGTKKLRNLGGDLGSTIKSFRTAMKDGDAAAKAEEEGEGTDPEKIVKGDSAEVVADQNRQRDRG